MNFRYSLLLGVAFAFGTVAGVAQAQQHKSPNQDLLLDQLTRHIQLCSEITDTQQRLACYDKVQNNVGGMPTPTPQPAHQATNRPAPSPTPLPPQPAPSRTAPPSSSDSYSSAPLTPPPLTTPGGGVATLGGNSPSQAGSSPSGYDPDRAFDPNNPTSSYGPADSTLPKPQPQVRRTGPRPLPHFSQPMPLVTLAANNLTYGPSRYWQVSISVTSNTTNTVNTQIQCTFRNAGRSVGDAYFGPVAISPGEQISTELIGPPTSTYVDSTNCKVLSP
jgi:hypothetical protein